MAGNKEGTASAQPLCRTKGSGSSCQEVRTGGWWEVGGQGLGWGGVGINTADCGAGGMYTWHRRRQCTQGIGSGVQRFMEQGCSFRGSVGPVGAEVRRQQRARAPRRRRSH